MKKYIILSLAALSFLTTTGCMDDYLNEPSASGQGALSSVDAYSSIDGAKATMAALLRLQRTQWSEYATTDAGGLYAMLFARTVKGSDIQLSGSWYNFDYDNDNREPTYRRTAFTWRYCYMMIAKLNQYLEGIENSTALGTEKNNFLAQAKALRGFYYFQLALEFNHAYKYDTKAAAPPVYTEINFDGKPMGTLEELYAQITSDLEYAYANISTSRIDNSWVNKNVTAGMLANVYLSMENWAKAETYAKAAYGGNVLTALHTVDSYKPVGFDNYQDKEWLWSLPQVSDQTNYYYMAPHAFTHYGPGYNNAFVNSDFVAKFAANDRRKEAIGVTSSQLPVTRVEYWKTNKFVFAFDSDMVVFRTPEFILAAAEAAYRQGRVAEAQTILNQFKSTRYRGFVNESLTGNALLEEILLERRKELYGENGIEWFDAKRLQRGITRTGNHLIKKNLEPNDKRFILKIPQTELDSNKNIPESINNGR